LDEVRQIVARQFVTFPRGFSVLTIQSAWLILTTIVKGKIMFTKLNETELFKSLSAAFRSDRKEIAKKAAAASQPETRKTEEPMSGDKAVRSLSFATRYQISVVSGNFVQTVM
jgi:hypothetical protein